MKLDVLLTAPAPPELDPAAVIPVFHRWIQESRLDELAIDVADYRHVSNGPGILLVCHGAHYALGRVGDELRLLFSGRRGEAVTGDDAADLRRALASVLTVAIELAEDEELSGAVRFPASVVEVALNERPAGRGAAWRLRTELDRLFGELAPGSSVEIEARDDRGRPAFRVRVPEEIGARELLRRLGLPAAPPAERSGGPWPAVEAQPEPTRGAA